ncbi:kinase-like protein [Neocallimastix sp. 'constans']
MPSNKDKDYQEKEQKVIAFIESTIGEQLTINDNLQRTLRSGLILCRMIQKIKPELMPRISARPLPFLQMENIHNFLNAVKELGVKPVNLFQTAELYEGTNMKKVIHTLISFEKVLKGEDDEPFNDERSTDSESSNNNKKGSNGEKDNKSKHQSTIEIFEQSHRNSQGSGKSPSSAQDQEVEQYQLGNDIGRGQFGCVYRALNLVSGQIVAIKRIRLEDQNKDDIDSLMQEVELLQSLSHPCIVNYYGFILNDEYLDIILEFVENGSLLNTLKSFGKFPEKLIANYTVKILEGLEYLHTKGVVHCDLKAANVLTTKSGDVKLTDFGVSRRLNVMDEKASAVVGTPNWMAPEIITLKGIVPQSDLWSLGCTIIELYTGKPPYSDLLPMAALFHIVEDSCPPLPDDISEELEDFLHICFKKKPSERTSATKLLEHKWILQNTHHKLLLKNF